MPEYFNKLIKINWKDDTFSIVIEAASVTSIPKDVTFPLSNQSPWIKSSDNVIIPKETLRSIQNNGFTVILNLYN